MVRLGLLRSMLAFGVLQAVSKLLYCALALAGKKLAHHGAAVTIEHLAAVWVGIGWSRSSWRCAMCATAPFSTRCCRCCAAAAV